MKFNWIETSSLLTNRWRTWKVFVVCCSTSRIDALSSSRLDYQFSADKSDTNCMLYNVSMFFKEDLEASS